MKKLAARDFEDLLQVNFQPPYLIWMLNHPEKCAIPVFEDLFEETHNKRILKLLYRTAEWHALAKLRIHSDSTLTLLDELTVEFGKLMRQFRDLTCSQFQTLELPRETAARYRRQTKGQATAGQLYSLFTSNPAHVVSEPTADTALPQPPISVQTSSSSHSQPQPTSGPSSKTKRLNLFTVKFHFLGDYVHHIRLFGTTDSYSTQLVCSSSRFYYPIMFLSHYSIY